MPHTDTSFLGIIGASFVAAFLRRSALCPMPHTDFSLLDLVGASLMATFFDLCSMPHTNPILHYIIFASINRAQLTALLFRRAITFLDGYLALCNHAVAVEIFYLYLALPHLQARGCCGSSSSRGIFARRRRARAQPSIFLLSIYCRLTLDHKYLGILG